MSVFVCSEQLVLDCAVGLVIIKHQEQVQEVSADHPLSNTDHNLLKLIFLSR